MNAAGIALVWLFAQVTVVLVAVAAVYAVLGRATPRTRSTVLSTGLTLTVVLTLLAFSPWPNWWPGAIGEAGVQAEADEPSTDVAEGAPATGSASADTAEGAAPPLADEDLASPWSAFATEFVESLRNPVPAEAEAESRPLWPAVVVWLFGASTGLGLLRMLAGCWVVRRLRAGSRSVDDPRLAELLDVLRAETGCTRAVAVRESEAISPAATCGWRKPVVLLSANWRTWSDGELRVVLAHELSHVRRGDFPFLLWTELGVLLHFYHPLMHWLANRARLERELAADADAAELTGGPRSYLRVLAEMVLREPSQRTSWSVATFLPTRRTFSRRIEVLRELRDARTRRRAGWGTLAAAVSVLVGTGLVAAGLRGPGTSERAAATEDEGARNESAAEPDESKADGLDLSYLPRDVLFLFQIDVAALRRLPGAEKLEAPIEALAGEGRPLGVPISTIRRLTVLNVPGKDAGERPLTTASAQHPLVVVHTTEDVTAEMVQEHGGYEPGRTVSGTRLFEAGRNVVALPEPRTLIYSTSEEAALYAVSQGERGAKDAAWADDLRRVNGATIVGFGNVAAVRGERGEELDRQFASSGLGVLAPIPRNINMVVAGVTLNDDLAVEVFASCVSAEGAKTVEETTRALVVLGKNWVEQARLADLRRMPRGQRLVFDEILARAGDLLASLEVEQKDDVVEAAGRVKGLDTERLVSLVLPALRDARTAARRTQAMNNLKQLAIAMHNFHDQNGHVPPAVLTGPDGETKYSWRVALLPYLDQGALYKAYDRTQPWDSEHNKRVLAKMPPVFRDPHAPADGTNASYFALVGEGTVFDGGEGTPFREITDGTSNTIMLVSAKRKVPWTKPEDVEVDLEKKLPELGGYYDEVFLAAFCDGSVRAIPESIDAKVLKALIGKADGQIVPREF